jgi:hypothetical protein
MDYADELWTLLNESKSGFELMGSQSSRLSDMSEERLLKFLQRALDTEIAFVRYQGVKQLRVWQALALHHFLDPDVLGLSRKGSLQDLARASRTRHGMRLQPYVATLKAALSDIGTGELQCLHVVTGDEIQSYVSCDELRKHAQAKRWHARRPNPIESHADNAQTKLSEQNDPETSLDAWVPQALRDAIEGCKGWQSIEHGGSFDPLKRSTEPDLLTFFRSRGHNITVAKALVKLCRPANAKKGRPDKVIDQQLPMREKYTSH